MADTNPSNLEDMIAVVSSLELLQKLFKRHAPDLPIDWSALQSPATRPALLASQWDILAAAHPKACGKIFNQLNTIALINADADNSAVIQNEMDVRPKLKSAFINMLDVSIPDGKHKTANLAAFINIVKYDEDSPAQKDADEVWADLLAAANAQLANIKHCPRTKLTEPTIPHEGRTEGLRKFEEVFRLMVMGHYKQQSFLISVVRNQTDQYERYVVKTSPLEHDVSIVGTGDDGKQKFMVGPDTHANSFEILYDETHNKISASKTRLVSCMDVIRMFAQYVLGAEIEQRRKLSYTESLQVFKSPDCLEKIVLPEKNVKEGDILWIDSIKLQLARHPTFEEEQMDDIPGYDPEDQMIYRTPTIYTGTSDRSVFDEMKAQIDNDTYPVELRTIMKAVVKVQLRKSIMDKDDRKKCLGRGSDTSTYTITISDGSFSIPQEGRCYDAEHLKVLRELKDKWGFQGLTIDQTILGKKEIDVSEILGTNDGE